MVRNRAREVYLKLVFHQLTRLVSNGDHLDSDELAKRIRETPQKKLGVRVVNTVANNSSFYERLIEKAVYEAVLEKTRKKILYYSPGDIQFVLANSEKDADWFAAMFYVSRNSIYKIFKRKELRDVRGCEPWRDFEDQYIIDHHDDMNDSEIGEVLGRSWQAVRHRRRDDLGFNKNLGTVYTDEMEEYIVVNDRKVPRLEMARHLGISYNKLKSKVHKLKVSGKWYEIEERLEDEENL